MQYFSRKEKQVERDKKKRILQITRKSLIKGIFNNREVEWNIRHGEQPGPMQGIDSNVIKQVID